MRISEKLVFDLASQRIGKARSDAALSADQVSSGKRIQHPGDGSAEAGLITRYEHQRSREDSIQTATTRATEELSTVDTSLGRIADALTRAMELAVQLANDTYNAQDRQGGAVEVQNLLSGVVANLNVQHGDRYVFGGMKDGAPPFAPSGAYLGDANVRKVEIAPGVLQDASIRADQTFKGVGGGLDVLTALQNFATALNSNNLAGIQTAVKEMGDSVAQVAAMQSRVGGMYDVMDTAISTARLNRDAATKNRSAVEDIDIFQASTNFTAAQQALQATAAAASKQFSLTLLDKL